MAEGETSKPAPPDEISFTHQAKSAWDQAKQRVIEGKSIDHELTVIDARLQEGRRLLSAGALSANYDWELDLLTSEDFYGQCVRWAEDYRHSVDQQFAFWRENLAYLADLSSKVRLAGLQVLFAINSAVAIAALNALSSADNNAPRSTPGALHAWAFLLAGIGVLLTGAAHWALSENLSNYTRQLQYGISGRKTLFRLKALYRWNKRYKGFQRSSDVVRVAALWTGAYLSLLMIVYFGKFLVPG